MLIGKINKILPHSLVDGPGNRAVVFMQGCSLHCLYCHNPYTINYCNHCGECVPVCPTKALSVEGGKVLWSPSLCEECDACVDACSYSSSPKTYDMSVERLWEKIKPLAPFISGITMSGGEPTLQLNFIIEFFHKVKAESKLTTCIETNGTINPSQLAPLLPVLDFALVDLKVWDSEIHKELTQSDNQLVKKTLSFLAKKAKLHEIRLAVLPGYTDSEENTSLTARFIAELDPDIPFRLLRFRSHGTKGIAQSWQSPSEQMLEKLVKVAQKHGLRNVERSL